MNINSSAKTLDDGPLVLYTYNMTTTRTPNITGTLNADGTVTITLPTKQTCFLLDFMAFDCSQDERPNYFSDEEKQAAKAFYDALLDAAFGPG